MSRKQPDLLINTLRLPLAVAGEISQDEQKKMEAEVQKDTDAAIKRIDETLKAKEVEIMQV